MVLQTVKIMKFHFFLPFIFLFVQTMGFTQNDDYYQLVKDGTKFKKPIHFLHQDQFKSVKTINGKKFFISKKNRFVYNPKKHSCNKLSQNDISKINITSIEELYEFEKTEFKQKADIIEKKTGWRPVPPLGHNLLKIYILKKTSDNNYIKYEVDWMSGIP